MNDDDDDDDEPELPPQRRLLSRAPDGDPVGLVILTGFLGAGKTTVLNRVLEAPPRWRLAVVVNELGRIDIDGKLLRARAGDVVELAGGCVCHEVRTQAELESALAELLARSRPERIVLETTGIAEPQAIVDGLTALGGDEPAVVISAVITVVDADAGADQLERHREARAQVALADRILLTKLDLADHDRLSAVHRALDALNPHAERATFPAGASATRELAAWLLDAHTGTPRSAARPDHLWGRRSHSDHQLVAVAFSDETPLLGEP
jgi:G3E family GTPase